MKSRRYFLAQGTLATTAFFALKPLSSIGKTMSQVTGFNTRYGKLSFLHTADLTSSNYNNVVRYVREIKDNNSNTILLNAGQNANDEHTSLTYDVTINGSNNLAVGEYKIITKGNTRTGIITAKPGEANIIEKVKTLSSWLKKEKNCTVVVCLSQLGYKNKNSVDDITMARKTTDIDIIVGGHPENFQVHPIVALNNNNAEVIIHSASGNSFDCGKIEIDFDGYGRKNQVSFANNISKDSAKSAA